MTSATFPPRLGGPAVYAGIFLAVLLANIYTPLWADDYCLMDSKGFFEPLSQSWRYYMEWSGRFFPIATMHYTMQLFSMNLIILFDALNAFLFVFLLYNIIRLVDIFINHGSRELVFGAISPDYIVLVALLLWWLPRTIGEVALWKTGSIVYLWAVAGEIWILRVLLSDRSPSWWMLLPVFIIANFLEPLSVLFTILFATALLYGIAANRRFAFATIAVHTIGTAILVLAPGNYVRAGTTVPSPLLDRLEGVLGNLGSLFDPLWIPAVAVIALTFGYAPPAAANGTCVVTEQGGGIRRAAWKGQLADFLRAGRGWVFPAAALLYMALLLGAPRSALAARVSFPASVLLVCYLAAIVSRSRPPLSRVRLVRYAVAAAVAATLVVVIPDLRHLHAIDARWARDPQLKMGLEHDAVLEKFMINNKYSYARKHIFFAGITQNPAYFINLCYAKSHNVRSVVVQ